MYPQKRKTDKILFSLKDDERLLIELHETKLLKNVFGIHRDDIYSFNFSVNKVIQCISVDTRCLYVLLYVGSTVWKS